MVKVSEGPALPAGRGSHAGGVVDGHAVIVGGTSWSADRTIKSWLPDSMIFDGTNWIPGPALPHAFAEGMFASDNHALYLAGGLVDAQTASVDAFRLTRGGGALESDWTWQSLPPLPRRITGGAGECVSEKLFITCGFADGTPTNGMWSISTSDPKSGWSECPPVPGPPRAYPALVVCNNNLYLLGGQVPQKDGGFTVLRDFYRYDLRAKRWHRLSDLPTGGYCWSASALDDHHLLVTGRADGVIHDDVWLINIDDSSVRSIGKTVIQAACAPLLRLNSRTWWFVGGEPDSQKHRTERVSVIHFGSR